MVILRGDAHEATDYLERTAGPELAELFSPIVSRQLESVGATRRFNELVERAERLPLVKRPVFDLTAYVTDEALAGLFETIGREEQRIREELGLAYAVYSFQSFYRHSGVTGVYVGTHPSTADQAVEAISQELGRLARDGLGSTSLAEAKQQVRGQVTLSLESPSARMHRLAGFSLNDEPFRTIDQTLRNIDAVTADQVADVAAEFLAPDRQTTVWLGPN